MTAGNKEEIFIAVLDAHKGIVYKIANSYCLTTADRDDLVQEIIFQLWRSFDRYNDQYKQSTWIYRIALNVAISFYRKETSRSRVAHPLSDTIFNISDIEKEEETGNKLFALQQFITELKELDKAIMLLYLEEKSYKEMAEIMGLTETNIGTKIGRIKARLKQKFKT